MNSRKLNKAMKSAVSVTWDGCHKIYICIDAESHAVMRDNGYSMFNVNKSGKLNDGSEAVDRVTKWYSDSCPLRFISTVAGDGSNYGCFVDVIPQSDDLEKVSK